MATDFKVLKFKNDILTHITLGSPIIEAEIKNCPCLEKYRQHFGREAIERVKKETDYDRICSLALDYKRWRSNIHAIVEIYQLVVKVSKSCLLCGVNPLSISIEKTVALAEKRLGEERVLTEKELAEIMATLTSALQNLDDLDKK